MAKDKSPYNKAWIIGQGIPIVESYNGNLTLRALHYRLVGLGMTNNLQHYKKVVSAMISARWEGLVEFDAFMDHERETLGFTYFRETNVLDKVDRAKREIKAWATSYSKNTWENQPIYPEVFIEKKALQGVFQSPCEDLDIALNPCKGYPSLTFLYDSKERFDSAIYNGKEPLILYFGDYDCSGEDIPRSIQDNLLRMGTRVELKRVALMEHQVVDWELPPAPTKATDTRAANWDGLGQVELDAVMPDKIEKLLRDAVDEVRDEDLYSELMDQQLEERREFKQILRDDFNSLLD